MKLCLYRNVCNPSRIRIITTEYYVILAFGKIIIWI